MKNPIKEKDKKKATSRVYRGGGWGDEDLDARLSFRYGSSHLGGDLGFRVLRNKKNEKSN